MSIHAISVDEHPPVSMNVVGGEVYEAFSRRVELRALAVVDEDSVPAGIVHRQDFLQRMAHPYGRSLYERRSVIAVMDPDPLIVRTSESLDDMLRRIDERQDARALDGFIVVDQAGKYRGVAGGLDVIRGVMEAKAAVAEELRRRAERLDQLNLELAREVQIRQTAEMQARRLAGIDPLTQLSNRRSFLHAFDEKVAAGHPATVIFVDLDRFKAINDTYSHLVGDEVLKIVADRIQSLEPDGLAARLGGDEFGLLCTSQSQVRKLDNFCRVLSRAIAAPCRVGELEVSVGASIGVARYPTDHADASAVLLAADLAMLRAKRDGGGHCFYDPQLDHRDDAGRRDWAQQRRA